MDEVRFEERWNYLITQSRSRRSMISLVCLTPDVHEKPRDEEYEAFCQWDQEEPE